MNMGGVYKHNRQVKGNGKLEHSSLVSGCYSAWLTLYAVLINMYTHTHTHTHTHPDTHCKKYRCGGGCFLLVCDPISDCQDVSAHLCQWWKLHRYRPLEVHSDLMDTTCLTSQRAVAKWFRPSKSCGRNVSSDAASNDVAYRPCCLWVAFIFHFSPRLLSAETGGSGRFCPLRCGTSLHSWPQSVTFSLSQTGGILIT